MVDPVVTAFRRGQVGGGPAGMLGDRLNGCGHQHRQGRAVAREGGQRGIRREARMDGDGGAMVQRRRGLDVEAADMEEGQHVEHVIVGGEAVHVLAHHRRSTTAPPAAAPRPWAFPWCPRCRRSAAGRRGRCADCGRRRARGVSSSPKARPRGGEKSSPTMLASGRLVLPSREEHPQTPAPAPALLSKHPTG